MKNKIVTPILAIVIAAVVLLGGKAILSGTAEKNVEIARNKIMCALLPGSTSFAPEEFDAEANSAIQSVYKAENGYVIESTAYGYNGDIVLMVGVSNEGTVTGVTVKDLQETRGLGADALTNVPFLAQFLWTGGDAEIGTNVDALAGATVSSKAVTKAVNAAVGYVTGADTSSAATEWGG
ncbi:MAG: FMN-binding protein [Lachnospiraceae bacterium]|nr:FMN-binding protein [Lachnospiraceae bacterium]